MGIRDVFREHPTLYKAFIVGLFIILANALTNNALIRPDGMGFNILSCSPNFKVCSSFFESVGFWWNVFVILLISLGFDLLLSKSHRLLFYEALMGGLLGSLLLSAVAVLQLFAYIPLFIILVITMLIGYIIGSRVHDRRSKSRM